MVFRVILAMFAATLALATALIVAIASGSPS
jgi:hypothetical protein